jgi:ribosomal protein S20
MNKKEKIQKSILKNVRNKIINRYYNSSIRSIYKLLIQKICSYETLKINIPEVQKLQKFTIQNILNNFYSILDKGVKKNLIRINRVSKKKSELKKICNIL